MLHDIVVRSPVWHIGAMPTRKSICISITPELDRFVAGQLASGRYQTASEVFRAGLRLLQRDEATMRPPRDLAAMPGEHPAAGPEQVSTCS